MSTVLGIDLSTKNIDIVALDESTNRAEWERVELTGANAWDRTLDLTMAMPSDSWYDDRGVFLVAIEEPYSAGQPGTLAMLNRVVGAVMASLPARLRAPERCWHVRPKEWRLGLGLKGNAKPTREFVWGLSDALFTGLTEWDGPPQDALDAYCIAMWARDTLSAATRADEPHVGAPGRSSPDREAL